mgnify:FL=1
MLAGGMLAGGMLAGGMLAWGMLAGGMLAWGMLAGAKRVWRMLHHWTLRRTSSWSHGCGAAIALWRARKRRVVFVLATLWVSLGSAMRASLPPARAHPVRNVLRRR